MFIVPLAIIITSYCSTFWTISRSSKIFNFIATNDGKSTSEATVHLQHCHDSARRRLILKAKKKSAKISLVIVIAFIVCWTPYYTMMLLFMFWNPDKIFFADLQNKIFFFGMANSLINPIIYGAFHLWPWTKNKSGSSRTLR